MRISDWSSDVCSSDLRSEVPMSINAAPTREQKAIVGEPEVVEDGRASGVEDSPGWASLKRAASELQGLQAQDGSVADAADHDAAASLVDEIMTAIDEIGRAHV